MNYDEDEIVSIEYVGIEDTIDIDVDSEDHLFFANGILTHNSAVDEIEFDHSHMSGGISKINTADNVFGIFTSRSMREAGRYQLQLMKTRSSSGVGQKVELQYDIDTLRITDSGDDTVSSNSAPSSAIMDQIRKRSNKSDLANGDEQTPKVNADVQSTRLKQMLANLKK